MTTAGVTFRDFFKSLTVKGGLPTLDISSEIAAVNKTSPQAGSAFEQLQGAYDALAKRLSRMEGNTFPEITVLSRVDGALIAWIGQRGEWEGIYARSIRIGPTPETATLYTDDAGNLFIAGSVIVGMPPSSLNVDFPIIDGLVTQNNTPGAGRVTWSAFTITLSGTTYSVAGGSTASSAETHIYWDVSSPTVLTAVAGSSLTAADGRVLIGTNISGTFTRSVAFVASQIIAPGLLQDGSVVAAKIAAGAVVAGKIAADAVTANEIAANAVTAAKINALAVTTAKIDANAVTTDKLAANSVTATEIAANAITTVKLNAASVTATKLNVKKIVVKDVVFTDNSPTAGKVAWTAGAVQYDGVEYAIASGNTSSATHTQITWTVGAGSFASAVSFTPGPTIFQIATNDGGTHDEVWDKSGNIAVQRTNLNFGLLEGYAPQTLATANIVSNGDTTILSESAEGGLLYIAIFTVAPVADMTSLSIKIQIDGATEKTYAMMDTNHRYELEAKTLAIEHVGDGSSAGDYILLAYGFTYLSSVSVKVNASIADFTGGTITAKVFYVHRVP